MFLKTTQNIQNYKNQKMMKHVLQNKLNKFTSLQQSAFEKEDSIKHDGWHYGFLR